MELQAKIGKILPSSGTSSVSWWSSHSENCNCEKLEEKNKKNRENTRLKRRVKCCMLEEEVGWMS